MPVTSMIEALRQHSTPSRREDKLKGAASEVTNTRFQLLHLLSHSLTLSEERVLSRTYCPLQRSQTVTHMRDHLLDRDVVGVLF